MFGQMALSRGAELLRREMSVTGDETNRWTISPNGSVSNLSGATAWVSIVDEVILTSTIIGSLSILGSMFYLEYKGRPATIRMRLVQSLVLSDLILGLVGIVGTSIVLSGQALEAGTKTCQGLGFSLTAVLWTEHLWTLILAVATYMILIYPLHPFTIWLERRWYFLWILVWIWAIVIGIIGYTLFGFFPNGGICYYGSSSGLYGELIHAMVMVCITILYARLFVFLRRPDRIRASFSTNDNTDMYDTRTTEASRSRLRLRPRALSELLRRQKGSKNSAPSEKAQLNEKAATTGRHDGFDPLAPPQSQETAVDGLEPGTGAHTPQRYKTITPPSTPDEPAPWEQIQLPIFHIDGERFGGRGAQTQSQGGGAGLHRETSSIWSGWKGLGRSERLSTGGDRSANRVHRPSTASSTSPNFASTSRLGSISTVRDPPASPRSVAQTAFPPTLEVDTPDLNEEADSLPIPARLGSVDEGRADRHGSISSVSFRGRVDQLRKQSAISAISSRLTEADELQPTGYLTPVTAVGSISASVASSQEQGRSRSLSLGGSELLRRGSALRSPSSDNPREPESGDGKSGYTEPQPPAVRIEHPFPPAADDRNALNRSGLPDTQGGSFRPVLPARQSTGMTARLDPGGQQSTQEAGDDDDDEDEWDLARMLQASAAEEPRRQQQDGGEEAVEFVEESMASYLNRKTALLMLWFPLGYVLLFSVSLIRIIYDFVGQPPVALRALSRWFIFAQGLLDALIYGLVEWHTKRVVRKRVRKGTFNTPVASRTGRGAGGGGTGSALNALRAFGQGSKLLTSRNGFGTGSQAGVVSQTGSHGDVVFDKSGEYSRTPMASRGASPYTTPQALATPRIPDTRTIMQELEVELDDMSNGSGTGSALSGSATRVDSRKGSTGSELGPVLAGHYTLEKGDEDADARGRERRKG